MSYRKNSHCGYCGTAFAIPLTSSGECRQCHQISYLNPLPVAVVLIPVEKNNDGNGKALLCIVRDIDPGKGGLALPGGYIELSESWQEGATREVFEETGIGLKAEDLQLFDVISVPNALLIFSIAKPVSYEKIESFKAGGEVSSIKLITEPEQMVFEAHSQAVEKYFTKQKNSGF